MTNCTLQKDKGRYWCSACDPEKQRLLLGPYTRNCRIQKPTILFGVGIELKRLLRKIGIRPEANCKCKDHAKQMDDLGVDWCEANIEQVIDWMAEEAKKRGYPFLRKAGRILVRRAIKNARRKAKFFD